jgi:hypothetical protein
MLTIDLDRLKVISSGSVVMKIDAEVCFPRGIYVGHIGSTCAMLDPYLCPEACLFLRIYERLSFSK